MNYFEYRIAIWKQERRIKNLEKDEPEPHPDPEMGSSSDYYTHLALANQWLACIETKYYQSKTRKALVDMPDLSDPTMYGRIEWDYDEAETPYLTQKGFKQVRADLRADFKLKVDVLAPIISTVTGLLGVVVAILAIVYAK
ncbi:hypothetical protein [Pseudomonas lini]|uniref:Uncharacterized protein n=1 Tax=Pseudomonas lini TaxID=163011 RepID=A0A7V7P2I8_9PSED|nr:hypothetical protein [Pseudomonas lini]KAB0502816.1 hypothetical protein F7R14_19480 [Pseudomonas lini]KMM94907.1 hypothetical protein TU81_00275 [Pseudomonas lini]